MASRTKPKTLRNAKIMEMFFERKITKTNIAKIMNISKQRVGKIIKTELERNEKLHPHKSN